MEFKPPEFTDPVVDNGKPTDNRIIPADGRFTSDYQPDEDSRRKQNATNINKRKGRRLFKALMQLPANGTNWVTDPRTGETYDQLARVRIAAAKYFGIPEGSVTVELLVYMKQVVKAIQINDTGSAVLAIDQAYGKVKEIEDVEDIRPAIININPLGNSRDDEERPPEVEESETPLDNFKIDDNGTSESSSVPIK